MDLKSVLIGVSHCESYALLVKGRRTVDVVLPDPPSPCICPDLEDVANVQVVQEGEVDVFRLHR